MITSEKVKIVRKYTGEGMMTSHHALKATGGDVDKAIDFLKDYGKLVAIKPRDNDMQVMRLPFEKMWRERFSFEMKRGSGRSGYCLKIDEVTGKYISDKAQFAWEIWQEAKKNG